MSFGAGKKLSLKQQNDLKSAATKGEESAESAISQLEEVFDDSFFGSIQRVRSEYNAASNLETLILPALPNELPVLKPPLNTTVIIQEESSDSAGMQDLYEGQIGDLARYADRLEKVAPSWLGELLLRVSFREGSTLYQSTNLYDIQNRIPQKDIVKVTFTLEPFDKELPIVTTNDG